MSRPTVLIPKGYRRAAETFNQYKKVVVKFYHSAEQNKSLIVIETVGSQNAPHAIGPLTAGEIETLHQTLGDVLAMKTGIRYLE